MHRDVPVVEGSIFLGSLFCKQVAAKAVRRKRNKKMSSVAATGARMYTHIRGIANDSSISPPAAMVFVVVSMVVVFGGSVGKAQRSSSALKMNDESNSRLC